VHGESQTAQRVEAQLYAFNQANSFIQQLKRADGGGIRSLASWWASLCSRFTPGRMLGSREAGRSHPASMQHLHRVSTVLISEKSGFNLVVFWRGSNTPEPLL